MISKYVVVFGLVYLFSTQLFAQTLPSTIKEINFFVRQVNSQGAYPSKVETYGTENKAEAEDDHISKQYFLYVQTKCGKKLELTSFSIDGVNYEYELVKVSSPVVIADGVGGEQTLVAKTKNTVYQVKVGKPIFVPNQKAMKPNNYISLEGKIKGKTFSYAALVKTLRALKAQ